MLASRRALPCSASAPPDRVFRQRRPPGRGSGGRGSRGHGGAARFRRSAELHDAEALFTPADRRRSGGHVRAGRCGPTRRRGRSRPPHRSRRSGSAHDARRDRAGNRGGIRRPRVGVTGRSTHPARRRGGAGGCAGAERRERAGRDRTTAAGRGRKRAEARRRRRIRGAVCGWVAGEKPSRDRGACGAAYGGVGGCARACRRDVGRTGARP